MKLLVQSLSKDVRLAAVPLEEDHADFLMDLALNKTAAAPAQADHAKELVALAYGIPTLIYITLSILLLPFNMSLLYIYLTIKYVTV